MNMVFVELRKAFGNAWFVCALIVGCGLASVSAFGNAVFYYSSASEVETFWGVLAPQLSTLSLFRFWMGSDYLQSATAAFYTLLPLIAALPYSWSVALEGRTGYFQQLAIRSSYAVCLISKSVAAFVVGSFVVTVPLILNFVLCACFAPAYFPDVSDVIYTGIYQQSYLSEVYYTDPFLYCSLFTLLDSVFAGLWAVFVLVLGLFVQHRASLLVAPYLALYLLGVAEAKVVNGLFGGGFAYSHAGITPFDFLNGARSFFGVDGVVIACWLIALLVLSVLLIALGTRRDVL